MPGARFSDGKLEFHYEMCGRQQNKAELMAAICVSVSPGNYVIKGGEVRGQT